MENRINKLFKKKVDRILSIYFTAGYPELYSTSSIIEALDNAGVDMIEIGMPYSDPLADGPTIQKSSTVALSNGMRLDILFKQISDIRKISSIPLVLMGYYNQLLQFGFEEFCEKCNNAGIDGLIIPDLPPENFTKEYSKILEKHKLGISFLITPRSTNERINLADKLSNTFVYVVSASSVTGTTLSVEQKMIDYFNRIKNMNLKNPILVGFGISNKTAFDVTCQFANGCIIGSAFIRALNNTDNIKHSVKQFINSIKK